MITMHVSASIAAAAALLLQPVLSLWPINDLATTPQMGWDNWNFAGCEISEDILLGSAEKIVDFGLADAGYKYIVLGTHVKARTMEPELTSH